MYKAVFCDLDETLFTSDKIISKEDVETIKRMQDAGLYFVPCTGRYLLDLAEYKEKYGLEFPHLVTCDGAKITLNNQLCYDGIFDNRVAVKVMDFLFNYGISIKLYSGNIYIYSFDGSDHGDHRRFPKVADVSKEEIYKLAKTAKVSKIIPFTNDYDLLSEIMNKINEACDNEIEFFHPHHTFIEICPKGQSKAKGVKDFCQLAGIDIKESIGIGDSGNDKPMLETVGLSCCVANAVEDIKKTVKHISKYTNNESAVTVIINEFVFGEKDD